MPSSKRGELVRGVQHRPRRLLRGRQPGHAGRGLDVDVCQRHRRGRCSKRRRRRCSYAPLTAQQRFTALQSGEVDHLSRNTTWTSTRDASLGLHFTSIVFYDGQGFLVPKRLNVKSAKALEGCDRVRAIRHHHRAQPE